MRACELGLANRHRAFLSAFKTNMPKKRWLSALPFISSLRHLEVAAGAKHQRRDVSARAVDGTQTRTDIEAPSIFKPSPPNQPPDSSSLGYAAIFGVAFLWGANVPALRYMFLLDAPPSSALLNCLQATISAVVLAGSVALIGNKESIADVPSADGDLSCVEAGGAHMCIVTDEDKVGGRRAPKNAVEKVMSDALNWTSSDIRLAGGELGLWMCLAFGLEIAGCEFISATKTAFLMQATVLITPVLVFLSGARVNKNEWAACGLGLAGSVLVALDGLSQASSENSVQQDNEILGYILVLLSTFFFSMGTVRLGQYSSRFNSLSLSNASTVSLAICSFFWLVFSSQGEGGASLSETTKVVTGILTNPTSLAVLLWLGVASGAFASFLLTTGQKTVPPAQAQVILATTPLFSTAIAMIVLDASDEAMGGIAWVGAGLMLLASVVASTGSPTDSEKKGAV
jgi:drug/metabolite transporter (DMT)-like permease